jgi:ABC-type glycerol-3-phosphate transport system substrate-binding protein
LSSKTDLVFLIYKKTIMKQLIMFFVFIAAAAGIKAQTKDTSSKPLPVTVTSTWVNDKEQRREWKNIPDKVKNTFTKQYPNAKNVKWTKLTDLYMAEFEVFGKKQVASLRPDGTEVN